MILIWYFKTKTIQTHTKLF